MRSLWGMLVSKAVVPYSFLFDRCSECRRRLPKGQRACSAQCNAIDLENHDEMLTF